MTAVASALHSVDSSSWFTPVDIIEAARDLMGGIDLDPASEETAQRLVKATVYLTSCGLDTAWSGRLFLNPPSPPREWWERLMRHVVDGAVTRAVFIAYSIEQLSQSQLWSQRTGLPSMLDWRVCIPRRRIGYMRVIDGAVVRGAQPPHASAIVGINVGRAGFEKAFGCLGACL